MSDASRWTLRNHVQTGRRRARCCDAAHAAERDGWRVLAVSDGVSSRADSHVGAHLVSRSAVHTALNHVTAGGPFPHIPNLVQLDLSRVLAAVHAAIGPENAASALPCTLVLVVVGPTEAAAWVAGDGDAGLVGIPETLTRLDQPVPASRLITWTSNDDGQTVVRTGRDPSRFSLHWRKRGPSVSGLPFEWVLPGRSRPLQRAFHVVGDLSDVYGAFVSTDGAPDPAIDLLFDRPVALGDELRELTCGAADDVGVAWGGPMGAQVERDHIDHELAATLETLGLADGGVSNV